MKSQASYTILYQRITMKPPVFNPDPFEKADRTVPMRTVPKIMQ